MPQTAPVPARPQDPAPLAPVPGGEGADKREHVLPQAGEFLVLLYDNPHALLLCR